MSREIKFRAWDKSEKRMIYKGFFDRNWYGTPRNDEGGCHTLRALMPDDKAHVELMQFTGLKDKNGKEIYEGDILSSDTGDVICSVYFGENEYAPRTLGWCIQGSKVQGSYPLDNPSKDLWKVIGNVWENPELLKCEK